MSDISETTAQTMTYEDISSVDVSNGGGELPGVQSYQLDGRNYLQWAQFIKTFLKGCGKGGHLIGLPPKKEDPSFTAWNVEYSRIMSWIWSTMQPQISKNYMFLSTAREICVMTLGYNGH